MLKNKNVYLFPVLVLLFLSLVTTASTTMKRAEAQSSGTIQHLTVYIHSLETLKGQTTLTGDEIGWYEGAAADAIFARREPEAAAEIGGVPDGYYIVNDSDSLTIYPVAPDAKVTMQIYDHTGSIEDLDTNWNEALSLQQFIHEFAKTDVFDLSQSPYHITIEDGQIVSIVQQYTP
jgi:UDP-3-O-acyl-N-acetylglucosamine deacetylase